MRVLPLRESLDDIYSQLTRIPAWEGIALESLTEMLSETKLLGYSKGEFIFMEGDVLDFYYILLHGTVRIVKDDVCGKAVTFAVMQAVETIGEIALFDSGPSTTRAEAMNEVTLLAIRQNAFRKFISENPSIASELTSNVVKRLKVIQDRLMELLTCSIDKRFVKVLIPLSFQFRKVLPLTHQDIADLMGVTRETISRKIEALQSQGIIATQKRGKIVILDENKLRQLAEKD